MNQRAPWCICHQSSFKSDNLLRQLVEFVLVKSELSSTAGTNLAAKGMYESTCAVVHLSSIIFHQSSFKSDNLLSFFSFCLTYYLQIAGRVYSREERAVINSWNQPRRMMFIVVGCFTVNSVNMKKKSCSEILKCKKCI